MQDTSVDYFDFLLKNDSGVRLLKSRSAKAVISFLYGAFRSTHTTVIPSDSLETSLASFLSENAQREGELEDDELLFEDASSSHEKARLFVSYWCSDSRSYLRRFEGESGDFFVELSPGVERLFNYLEDISKTDFVGTESRFKNILSSLKDLEEHIKADPAERIAELEAQKAQIEREINEIRESGVAPTYSSVQITERLDDISRRSRDLLSDFHQVEDNFRAIMKDIYRSQNDAGSSRGKILGYTLDTSRRLRESPQGQSFQSFWRFISQDRDDKIGSLVKKILSEKDSERSDDFLVNLKKYLYQAGHKVVEQNRVLSERINKMLLSQNIGSKRRIDTLTADVKKLMLSYVKNIESGKEAARDDFMEVDAKCDIFFPQARYPVYPEQRYSSLSMSEFSSDMLSSSAFRGLFKQFFIDEKALKSRLESFRKEKNGEAFSLCELLCSHPVEKGLSEVIAWYDIAQKDGAVEIRQNEKETVMFSKGDKTVAVTLPRIIFYGR